MAGEFVVSQRVRLGGVVSAVLTVGGLLTTAFLVVSSPWWLFRLLDRAFGVDAIVPILIATVIIFALPLSVAVLAFDRPGNLAMRRRQLAMDENGIRFYSSARWWRRPFAVRWEEVGRLIAFTETRDTPSAGGPTPTLVPWDYLAFQLRAESDQPIRGTRIHVLWLTATVEQIVAEVHEFQPNLPFVDDRTPPPEGLGGRVLARRRKAARA